MRTVDRSLRVGLAILGLAGAAGCGGDATAPTLDSLAGTYAATQMNVSIGTFGTDLLASGASMIVTLHENGTTTGRLIVPQSLFVPEPVDEPLAGTWTLNGSTVTFTTAADTFVEDIEFEVDEERLVGDETFSDPAVGNVRVRVTLTRQ